jgi:hypothetical protein
MIPNPMNPKRIADPPVQSRHHKRPLYVCGERLEHPSGCTLGSCKSTSFRWQNYLGPLLAFSLTPSGSWVAYVGRDHPPPNKRGLRSLAGDCVVTPKGRSEVGFSSRFPMIAAVDEHTLVVADSLGRNQENVWLIDETGKVKAAFDGGDAKQQVLSAAQGIVVTYFDEGVYGGQELGHHGVNLFSQDGTHLRGFNKLGGDVFIDDCYCACLDDAGRFLFSPYMEFPLVRLDLETWEQQIWRLPKELHSSRAVAATSTTAYFWGSVWRDRESVLAFDLESGRISDVGSVTANRRLSLVTLRGGRFVAPWQDHYTIIDPRS